MEIGKLYTPKESYYLFRETWHSMNVDEYIRKGESVAIGNGEVLAVVDKIVERYVYTPFGYSPIDTVEGKEFIFYKVIFGEQMYYIANVDQKYFRMKNDL